jgi:hypothetical protein
MVTRERLRRGDVLFVQLEPTRGVEIWESRLCVVVSSDELNVNLRTVIVAPLTKGGHAYPFRVPCKFGGKDGTEEYHEVHEVFGSVRVLACLFRGVKSPNTTIAKGRRRPPPVSREPTPL